MTGRAGVWAGAILALMATVAAGGAPPGPAPPAIAPRAAGAPAPPAAEMTPAQLRDRLMASAAAGKLTEPVLVQFRDYAAALAHDYLTARGISEDFLKWLSANKEMRDAVLITFFPSYDVNVVKRLEALKSRFGSQVAAYPHLALAFAFVYGRAGAQPPRDPHMLFAAKDREIPKMEDSFEWYIRHEREMRMPLKATPWPLLVYVADNDAPLEERTWALQRYANCQPAAFRTIYYDVEYDNSGLNGAGKLGDRPLSLPNIATYGGICMHRAYYASRVLKSMGVPALYDHGEGERGGHAWVAWVGRETQALDLLFAGRFDYDRYYTGIVFNPLTRRPMLDRDVQLDVAAMVRSYPGYMDALVGCEVFQMFKPEDRAKAVGLLDGASQKNAYCDFAWRLMGAGVADGTIPQKQGERMFDGMLRSFAAYPDLTFYVLDKILAPRLKPSEKPAEAEIARNLLVLEKAFQIYEAAKRPDLSVRLRCLQGQYLEAVGRREEALKHYVLASEKYASEHYGFLSLYDRAVKMMREDRHQDMMLKYMDMVAAKVPRFQSDFNQKYDLINPAYVYVVKAYASALRTAGRAADADIWDSKIPAKKPR